MAGHQRVRDRGITLGGELCREAGRQLRIARLASGLSQAAVANAAGMSISVVSRVERGRVAGVSVRVLALLFAVTGLRLTVKGFPDGDPVRDAAHVRLLARVRGLLPAGCPWKVEVPLPISGDRRAWDAMSRAGSVELGIEAETRMTDSQAVVRRTLLKQRDGRVDRVLLAVADTPHNRAVVAGAAEVFAAAFPVPSRTFLAAVRRGQDPGGDAIVFV